MISEPRAVLAEIDRKSNTIGLTSIILLGEIRHSQLITLHSPQAEIANVILRTPIQLPIYRNGRFTSAASTLNR